MAKNLAGRLGRMLGLGQLPPVDPANWAAGTSMVIHGVKVADPCVQRPDQLQDCEEYKMGGNLMLATPHAAASARSSSAQFHRAVFEVGTWSLPFFSVGSFCLYPKLP
jgi:hypothetical protein